jgi:hypothetical protein
MSFPRKDVVLAMPPVWHIRQVLDPHDAENFGGPLWRAPLSWVRSQRMLLGSIKRMGKRMSTVQ